MKTLSSKILRFSTVSILAVGLLSACAPPPATMNSSNLTVDMRRLQSKLAEQQKLIDNLASQVTGLEGQLQRQAQELEQLRQAPSQTSQAHLPQSGQSTASAAQPIDGHSPTEIYLQSFGDYASGRYPAAINGFETFLQRFPNNSYASNAQFWLGECYFNQQQYLDAIREFEKVLRDYPRAVKSPEALLKIATAQLQLGENELARQSVEALKQRYPKSTAVQKAQELPLP